MIVKFLFNDDNFAHFFYKILNPNVQNSFLMKKDNFNENYLIKLQEFLQSSFDHDFSLLETMERSEFKEFNQYKFYKEFHRINVSKEYLKKEEMYFEKN